MWSGGRVALFAYTCTERRYGVETMPEAISTKSIMRLLRRRFVFVLRTPQGSERPLRSTRAARNDGIKL